MKIGIYGDSFAHSEPWSEYRGSKSWVDYLKDTPDLEIENYAVSGTGVYYSYHKFLETYTNYDKCIFFVSASDRVWLSGIFNNDLKKESIEPYYTNGRWKTEHRHTGLNQLRKVYDHIDAYYGYFHNFKKEERMAALMLDHITRLIGQRNVLIVPCFIECFNYYKFSSNIPLYDITAAEEAHWKINYYKDYREKYCDIRRCHMSDQNNKMIGSKIRKWLDNGNFSLDESDIVMPEEAVSSYLKAHSLVEKDLAERQINN